jgi:N-acetylmuramate 1-kinase
LVSSLCIGEAASSEVVKSHNSPLKAIRLPETVDTRLDELHEWLRARFAATPLTLERASADASFRRYFRVRVDGSTWIAMDAPPGREDCAAFVRVAGLMRAAGVNAPAIVAQDMARGFLLLTDFGDTTYLAALTADNADPLFSDAFDALIRWQLASRADGLPPYDAATLQRECDFFPQWYIARHLGVTLPQSDRQTLGEMSRLVIARSLVQPCVYVHRDYMPRNLMVTEPNPGIIDFQDARYGPITYDIASLLRDAFVSWDEARVIDWTVRYWERARRAGLPVDPDFGAFYEAVEWMGLQRHLKVLGIFARIHYRDGKAGYLEDTPRFMGYARAVAGRYSELAPLARLLARLAP